MKKSEIEFKLTFREHYNELLKAMRSKKNRYKESNIKFALDCLVRDIYENLVYVKKLSSEDLVDVLNVLKLAKFINNELAIEIWNSSICSEIVNDYEKKCGLC